VKGGTRAGLADCRVLNQDQSSEVYHMRTGRLLTLFELGNHEIT
jgi:hypothetical protein